MVRIGQSQSNKLKSVKDGLNQLKTIRVNLYFSYNFLSYYFNFYALLIN